MKFKLYYCYCLFLTVGPERLQQLPVQRDPMDSLLRRFFISFLARMSKSGELSSESLYVIIGKENIRDSGSKNKRTQSKTRDCSSVTCWNCKEVGHFKNQCTNDKQVNIAEDFADEDLLVCCTNSSVNSWVIDFGASFHVTHSSEALQNLIIGDFGKVRLVDN